MMAGLQNPAGLSLFDSCPLFAGSDACAMAHVAGHVLSQFCEVPAMASLLQQGPSSLQLQPEELEYIGHCNMLLKVYIHVVHACAVRAVAYTVQGTAAIAKIAGWSQRRLMLLHETPAGLADATAQVSSSSNSNGLTTRTQLQETSQGSSSSSSSSSAAAMTQLDSLWSACYVLLASLLGAEQPSTGGCLARVSMAARAWKEAGRDFYSSSADSVLAK
jgi:hypothetical protein